MRVPLTLHAMHAGCCMGVFPDDSCFEGSAGNSTHLCTELVLNRPEPLASDGCATPLALTLPPAALMLVRLMGGRLHLVKLPLRLCALLGGGTAWAMPESADMDGPDSPDMLPMLREGKSNTAASEKEVLAVARLTRASCCWCCCAPGLSCDRRLPPTAALIAIGSDRACCSPLCPASEERNRGLMGLTGASLEPALPPNKPPKKLPLPRKLPLPLLLEAVLRAGRPPAPLLMFDSTRSWCGLLGAERSAAVPAACGDAVLPCSAACRPLDAVCCTDAFPAAAVVGVLPACCCTQAAFTTFQRAKGLQACWSGNKLPAASCTAGRKHTTQSLLGTPQGGPCRSRCDNHCCLGRGTQSHIYRCHPLHTISTHPLPQTAPPALATAAAPAPGPPC
jgi:hypothetical protein